jgi:hypothetical protein
LFRFNSFVHFHHHLDNAFSESISQHRAALSTRPSDWRRAYLAHHAFGNCGVVSGGRRSVTSRMERETVRHRRRVYVRPR